MSKIDHNVVCLMPWITMHTWPNGDTFPCCMSDSQEVFGNVHKESINDLINNDNFKELRRQMINGEKPKVCSRCYELEDTASSWTLRKNSLQSFKQHLPLISNTNDDGSIDEFKMRYLDIRFSNLCNYKCRTCGPSLSSTWHEDQIVLYPASKEPKFIDLKSNPNYMEELTPHLDTIEEVYFAGGEALITPQHYEVLDYWLATGRTDVRLRYTTNFSSLRFKTKNILDYWKKFKDVRVAASLDTYGKRAEYARKGTNWKNIVANRKEMMRQCPDVYFEITPTVSLFSVHSLFDFHRTWVENGLLDINNIRINILTHPRYFSVTVLDWEHKEHVKEIYTEYAEWLTKNNAHDHTKQSIQGVVDHMYSADNSDLIPEFHKQIITIDFVRDENFEDVYPELTFL